MSGSGRTGHGRQHLALLGALAIAECAPAYGPAGVEFVVLQPPAARVEVRVAPPGPAYVWIGGYYAWRRSDYVWISGRWDRPPQPLYRVWEPGRWVHARQGWYWVEGHWR